MHGYDETKDWEKKAKCLDMDTVIGDVDIFYPPRDKALYKPVADKAKALCKGKDGLPPCPVKKACLLDAIRRDEQWGIWGGMSHRERNALVRKASKLKVSVETVVNGLDKAWDTGEAP